VDKKRYHDLDALRGFAMLLGIVIHGLMSFMPIPLPVPQDINQSPEIYEYVFNIIHGLRMPPFFLISGVFTAMLWRNRGLRNLLKHRAKRILLPMVVAVKNPLIRKKSGIRNPWMILNTYS
jgi:fucose 4-O-acetylase-like acetyltransferase